MVMAEKILGIDLGTTNSEVALYENGTVTIIEGPDGKLLPSYVGLDDNNNLLVGGPAVLGTGAGRAVDREGSRSCFQNTSSGYGRRVG